LETQEEGLGEAAKGFLGDLFGGIGGVKQTQWNFDFRLFGENPLEYMGEKIYDWRYPIFAVLIGYYMLESQADQKWKGD